MSRLLAPWQARLPRVAVATHDIAMVWLVWFGLHWMRYARSMQVRASWRRRPSFSISENTAAPRSNSTDSFSCRA